MNASAYGVPPRPKRLRRSLVIAVGNRFRGDDGVAGAVLDVLAQLPGVTAATDLVELDGEPTRLVDAWSGRARVVVVDAVHAPQRAPGELVVLSGDEAVSADTVARWTSGVSGHSAGLSEALRLGSVLGRMPDDLCIVGVVVASVGHGTQLSTEVAAAVPAATRAVTDYLGLAHPGRGDSRPRATPGTQGGTGCVSV